MYYLIGMCNKEMRDFPNAHDAFNNAIMVSFLTEMSMKCVRETGHRLISKCCIKIVTQCNIFNINIIYNILFI